MKTVTEGTTLWTPTEERIQRSSIKRYMNWLKEKKGLAFETHQALWNWSVEHLEEFWESVWEYCEIKSAAPYRCVLEERKMPGAKWFPGATLNYAENVFRNERSDRPALLFRSERVPYREVTWKELKEKTAAVASALKKIGVKPGDRVVAYMPNIPETVIAFLACASIGAIWSSCSPDFGAGSVIDRFQQIEPAVLFAIDGCQYNGKEFDKRPIVDELRKKLPSLKKTILLPYLRKNEQERDDSILLWDEIIQEKAELSYEYVPFDHPLWILYSSGTTGLPKPIVQGHGGILIEHLKTLMIEQNITKESTFFWFTTTGWMMWNFLIGGLLVGAAVVLYDGSPTYPDGNALWELAEKARITHFGTSAAFINICMKHGIKPKESYDFSGLEAVLSTGSPLTAEGFLWVYENVKDDICLVSCSGGTDVCTAFVGGSPMLPVRAGVISCRALGAKVQAFDENGNPLINEVGELVVTEPMPSMPLFFWNDSNHERYMSSYFDTYPGVWKHGDWIKINEEGGCIIYGRSDSTINRAGVRMGTSEIYRVVEAIDEVLDSLIIDLEMMGRTSFMPLFVVLNPGAVLDEALKEKIRQAIRQNVSPRFVPDEIYQVKQIPKTLNGKKMEIPIRKLLLGFPLEKAVNPGSMANPESLEFFMELSAKLENNVKHQ
ncbi:acetoacetate--CoA ligase [Parageobacillus thermoglucosidasius]|uniref:Acetoacetate--CoA ligase n=1 Tax=Parageobacillus thermoglucosidasius TaxID=1426 RepID=A0AAN1D8J9_PARTM|nr:acetoacetate--CoA ligase [Parageobacillus thermoglucosidasius]KYD16037.1 Acetoacetyl-CoA synthetase [Anoxybacillus flavithermus]REK58183.1 MAG: acetoacetate--CoA ligase [Geobacillus sp.]ALF11152.1 acetoacetyl-CoA synthetase [Parageobacillus thermoglucosidasius]ANZ32187.1 acetoacetate--CoA ligase [Parageobacillus thermoglucosidasius]APM81965.1 acetoacetate--CoA ligase [Parageobacillus thermoglucosidasius]